MKGESTRCLGFAVLVVPLLYAAVTTASAATITVTNTADSGPGSLRAALVGAADGDTIDATGVSGTIKLTSGELLVTNNLSIIGPGPACLAIDGNFPNTTNRGLHVIKDLSNGLSVAISGLSIINGHDPFEGGGIFSFQA